MRSDLTSEAVWRPQWPQNLILFVCLQLMEVLNLLTTNQFLQNSSKNLQKSSKILQKSSYITQKSNSSFPSVSAATLLGPNLVFVFLQPVSLIVAARSAE